ncbi:hypothetical protein ONZ43_g884 [Nemania bipapillata]|uniref:Uncharacterized protein n=1 Tax=Nemania bipapillata TaxID=110536 RepID=A0ACC2J6N9_9PEZI|nr:hypothetical protein ONZ43_g884 [Nemania bipapillata]
MGEANQQAQHMEAPEVMGCSSNPSNLVSDDDIKHSEKAPNSLEKGANPAPGNQEPRQRVIEEGDDAYRPGGFHPVYIGDIYNNRYKILNKIGYGCYSTVWVVEDLQHRDNDGRKYLALKVLSAICYHSKHNIFEREILKHLRAGDSKPLGYDHVCHLLDDFEHEGPNGTHVCLVFELYGESMTSFGAWFRESMIPTDIMRRFTIQLLCVLDFAHDHGVIHTDIQPSNIFVKFRDYSLIESKYLKDLPLPHQDRNEKYTAIPSLPFQQCYFTEADDVLTFDIALGDWGVASWTDKHLTEIIQPVGLRAPEVLIKAPWDAKTDFWNLGAVILELYRAIRMFSGRVPPDGHYEVRKHLAEIVDFLGPFPQALLDKGDQKLVQEIFDEKGRIKGEGPMDRPKLDSEVVMPRLHEETRAEFTSFLRAMMKIDPAERPSADDLLRFPWLSALPPKGQSPSETESNEGEGTAE